MRTACLYGLNKVFPLKFMKSNESNTSILNPVIIASEMCGKIKYQYIMFTISSIGNCILKPQSYYGIMTSNNS